MQSKKTEKVRIKYELKEEYKKKTDKYPIKRKQAYKVDIFFKKIPF